MKKYLYTVFLILLTLTLLELFTYSGFIKKHLFLAVNIYLYIGFLLIIIFIGKFKKKLSGIRGEIIFIVALLSLLMMIGLASLELIKYPNFVFSKTHIEIKNFPVLVAYLLSVSFIFKSSTKLITTFRSNIYFYSIFTFLVASFIFKNAMIVSASARRLLPPALAKPTATYVDKMYYLWSEPYKYFEAVQGLTDDNSVIYLPHTSSAQGITGNGGLARYFLYPRKLVSYEHEKSKDGYLIVSPGNELGNGVYGLWPNMQVEADYYYVIDIKIESTNKVLGNYNPNNIPDRSWALIKI
jgi:hypothetical protein